MIFNDFFTVEVTRFLPKPTVTAIHPIVALNTPAREYNPRLAHDGTRLLFLRSEASSSRLLWTTLPADATTAPAPEAVPFETPPAGRIEFFAVSPDGK